MLLPCLFLIDDHIKPVDGEGQRFLDKIPIVEVEMDSEELAKGVYLALQNRKSCMARGNGIITIGANLKEAYVMTCMVEHISKIKSERKLKKIIIRTTCFSPSHKSRFCGSLRTWRVFQLC